MDTIKFTKSGQYLLIYSNKGIAEILTYRRLDTCIGNTIFLAGDSHFGN